VGEYTVTKVTGRSMLRNNPKNEEFLHLAWGKSYNKMLSLKLNRIQKLQNVNIHYMYLTKINSVFSISNYVIKID